MQLFLIFISLLFIVSIIRLYSKYKPSIDVISSKNRYEVLLWYSYYSYNYTSTGDRIPYYEGRKYIKLFTL